MRDMNRLTVNGEDFRIADERAVCFEEQTLTPEQKARARENIGAADQQQMGNLEAALDGILAIQAGLMGGDTL